SPQWVAYTGAATGLGDRWLEHVHPDDVGATRAGWARAIDTGETLDVEARIRRHDGAFRWFKIRARPTRDEHGRINRWFGSNTDIQDLRDAQEMMRELNHDLESRVLARTEQVRAVAEQLRVAHRMSKIGRWELDLVTGRVAWSEELYRLTGRDPASPPPDYDAHEELFTPESWADLQHAIERSRVTGARYVATVELIRPDGTRRTAVVRAEAVRDGAGVVVRLVGTLQDVTELVEAKSAMGQLSERLTLATSAAMMGIWDWDVRQNVLVWDDTMYRLYDVPKDRFAGAYEAWHAALHPDDRAPAAAALAEAVATGGEFRSAFRTVTSTGEIRHLRAAARVHHDPVTGSPRVIGVNWDVTDQRQVELALQGSEGMLRGILAHAGSSIVATDPDGTITHFNRAAEELLGVSAADAIGHWSPIVFHDPEELAAYRQIVEADVGPVTTPFDVLVARARLGRPDTREWSYYRRDGARIPIQLTVSALRDDDRQLVGYLAVAFDLSARKAEEDRLVTLNRLLAERSAQAESASHAKTMFLANMSHEIRTPMNAITGVAHLLTTTALDDDQRRLVGTIQRAGRTLLGMISDVLDLSKIEAGQLTLELAPLSIPRLVDDVVQVMTAYAAGKDLALTSRIEPEATRPVVGDALRLTQILTNLVSNAIRFTHTGHVAVTVRGRPLGGDRVELTFEVDDTGTGVDAETLGRLFSPFTQGEGEARRAGGT
ncbi:MAG: PAS domain-containing protein, partial [Myxococcota bacterium]